MNKEAMIEASIEHGVIGIHAFALGEDCDAFGRNFAPYVGIDEESATGTSNGALGCYLFQHHKQKEEYILRQGYSMKQPSEIITRLVVKENKIQKVWVGGTATIIQK
jgi:PhzF family phenazine biosynthesis protein